MQNQYGQISPRTAAFAVAQLLDAGQYIMVLERFGQVDVQAKNKSKTRKYRRYKSLPRAVAPLAEGVVPAGKQISYEDITATLEEYGDYVEITDVIADTHEDPVLKEMSRLCGEQAAETIECIRFSVLKSGTNVYYAGGIVTSRATVAAAVSRGDFDRVVRAFRRNKARTISKIVKASADVATEPVAPAFFGLGHSDLAPDIRNTTGFTAVEKYSDADKALPGEIGKNGEIRFICSALFEPWLAAGATTTTMLSNGAYTASGAADVYPILVVARDAYAIVPLQGFNSVTPAVINPGTPSIADPLGQKGCVSWKTYQTCAILNEQFVARIEVACTSNP